MQKCAEGVNQMISSIQNYAVMPQKQMAFKGGKEKAYVKLVISSLYNENRNIKFNSLLKLIKPEQVGKYI